ncbi:acyltransferase [Flavitalea sp. BT771]|uniref:acyltransferase family protein n=1 Tax=Flavitalea sp. BT771 TaxID=3063329 RepID=UPI0026E16B3F|nr:acyltransferase [Flavitalea sp. BT771]MDO6434138.1 acyltransferase [Flavitalea sp. BT771]MDV6223038.1 acyltransferase [Flavitalea sp. BT771]
MNKRIGSIDGWRIIAAMGVLYAHTWSAFNTPAFKVGGIDVMQILNLWGSGVHLFFVISGFCFYLVLSKQETYNFQTAIAFWKKRWLRIAPAFYVACTIFALAHYAWFPHNLPYRLFFNFIFLQNHIPNAEIEGIFWSLAVEWHFYLLLPLIFVQINRIGILRTVGLLFGIHLFLNLLHYKGIFMPGDAWWYTIFCNIGHFGWGILMGYFFATQKKVPFFSNWWSIFAGFVIAYTGKLFFYSGFVARMHSAGFIFQSIGPLLMTMGFACMIYSCLENNTLSRIWGNRYFAGLGRISYSFYLWHNFMLEIIFTHFGKYMPQNAAGVFLTILLVLVVLIPVSFISYKLFESFYFRRQLNLGARRG